MDRRRAGVRLILLVAGAVMLAGCRQDMHDQPKFTPQRGTTFFPDGRSVRPQVANTVARSQGDPNSYFSTGMINGVEGDGMPLPVTMDLLRRGQERFNIYCAPCHSRVGNGKGMIVQRGYYPAADLHSLRLSIAPLGHFFNVITNGYGVMPDYAAQVVPADRWAIAAYIRALQLSQRASNNDIAPGAKVVPLDQQMAQSGFPAHFLDAWMPQSGSAAAPAAVVPAAAVATTASGSASTGLAVKGSGSAAPNSEESASTSEAKSTKAVPVAAAKSGDAKAGEVVFMANCSMCHQKTRLGLPPLIPPLLGIIDRVGEARVREVARTGIPEAKPPMPPHPNMTDEQLNNLIAFLRTK